MLVVDDEDWARQRVVTLLERDGDVELAGECANGAEAVQRILELRPDVVFLDVQMPDFDGFDVLQAVGPDRMPLVVFATAFDEYAVRAFEAQALDYLLKPFDEERFRRALRRARERLGASRPESAGLDGLLRSLPDRRRYLRRFAARRGSAILFLDAADVDWLEAAGNYVALHVGDAEYMIRDTVVALEAKLDPDRFVRIHRSTIVNLDRIREVSPWLRGEPALLLGDGTRLVIGRAYRGRLDNLLANAPP